MDQQQPVSRRPITEPSKNITQAVNGSRRRRESVVSPSGDEQRLKPTRGQPSEAGEESRELLLILRLGAQVDHLSARDLEDLAGVHATVSQLTGA